MQTQEKKRRRIPEEEELNALLRQLSDLTSKAIINLGWYGGLTAGEISSLKWSDVSFEEMSLTVGTRRIPMLPELEACLREMSRSGSLVVSSPRDDGQFNRGSISRKIRPLLDSIGLQDVTMMSLRDGAIMRFLRMYPLEEVVRITDHEIRALQELYRRYEPEGALPQRKEKGKDRAGDIPRERLLKVLEQEGDTLDARIILLSWQGGLVLWEMAALRWQDIDLVKQTWQIGEERCPIPEGILPYLRQWSAQEYPEQYVLRGISSGTMVAPAFIARRGAEFLARHGLEGLSLNTIRGRGDDLKKQRDMVLALLKEKKDLGKRTLVEQVGLSPSEGNRLLLQMLSEGLICRSASGRRYTLPGTVMVEEQIRRFCRERKGQTFTSAEIVKTFGFRQNIVNYYINKLIAQGVVAKERYSVYRVLPDGDFF